MGNALSSSPAVVVAIQSSDNLVAVQNKRYRKSALKSICDEATWHQVVRRVEDAVQAAGERHHGRIIQLKCMYIAAMVTFIISFLAGFGMLFGGAVSGSGVLVGLGVFTFIIFAVSLVIFIVSFNRIGTEAKAWLSETVAAVNNFCSQLSHEFPGLVFSVADVKDQSFQVTLKRGQAPAPSRGQAPVAGSPPAQVPPAGAPPLPAQGAQYPPSHPGPAPYGHQQYQPRTGYYNPNSPYVSGGGYPAQHQPPYQQPPHQQPPPYTAPPAPDGYSEGV